MNCVGIVKHGSVELPPDAPFKEGERVEIAPVSASSEQAFVLRETALAVSTAYDLPDDLAVNHDYYLHGGSKQQPRAGRWISASRSTPALTERQAVAFTDKLLEFAAETSNLPPDLSAQHDHYLHGLPKR
jgi:hypothetical protein